jgi:NAD(P)-dependent dehydrogenase (short-subunit alcohol dehydrogenase family)
MAVFTPGERLMPGTSPVVVITGASAGVGRATAQAFARRGFRVGLIARGRDGLAGTAQDVTRLGGKAALAEADVGIAEQVESAAATLERELGPVDVWVNNAMASVFSPAHLMSPEEYLRVTEVTYLGCVYGTLAALRRMRGRGEGVIVQVGSALAYRSIPLQSAYCAAKHAVKGFTESVRCELIHERSRVRITMVHLPALNTPQFDWVLSRLPHRAQPVPPIHQPELAAEAIVWAARHAPREMKVGFPTLLAIELNKVCAGLLDRKLAEAGYDNQQTTEPEDPVRPDNLWKPVAGDHGAHGRFDSRARSGRLALWIATHGVALRLAIAALIVTVALLILLK